MRDFHKPGRSAVFATNGMCATSHPLAASVAIETLKSGGNAVDAAIAGAVLLGFCEPQMTGIGGDCFALISKPGEADPIGLNGSGRAPRGLDAAALRAAGHEKMPLYDANAVTVPGAVAGFCQLSADHGRLGLDRVLAPAISYAESGVPVAPRVAFDWTGALDQMCPATQRHFLNNARPYRTGEIFTSPGQAEVLRRIAADGAAAFYEGEIAEEMVSTLRAAGGSHTLDDFAATAPDYVSPLSTRYRDHDLIELPPNGQGAAALLLMNMLGTFDIAAMDPLGADRAHIEAEATKLAYDARDRFIADPAHRLDHMLAAETGRALAAEIDPDRAMTDPHRVSGAVHKDTIYITVVDRDRMAVSLIYSIFHSFGARLATDRHGILFQNRGAGFTLEAGHPNEAAGGKRPMHTIIPGMIRLPSGNVMPFGVMGGAYQSTGHARFMSNIVDFGMDPQTAIDTTRSFAEAGALKLERGYGADAQAALAAKGHAITVPDTPLGGAQAIRIDGDLLIGGSDPRKDGIALGY